MARLSAVTGAGGTGAALDCSGLAGSHAAIAVITRISGTRGSNDRTRMMVTLSGGE